MCRNQANSISALQCTSNFKARVEVRVSFVGMFAHDCDIVIYVG